MMSWVADAVATRSAPSATTNADADGSQNAEKNDRGDEQKLRQQEPAAAAAEEPRQQRYVERIDQRRPEKFDRIGRADQREQADGAEIDS